MVDDTGRPIGPRTAANRQLKPTSELPMHLEAYRQRSDIGAVVHAHPPVTIALSIAGISLADCLLPEVIVTLGIIPTTAYATPSSEENVRAIRELIVYHDALVLQRHGSLTVGDSPMQGYMRLETVEQNARIAFMLAQLGAERSLGAEEVEKLIQQRRSMGLSRPGEEADFCEACGVCHPENQHTSTLRPGQIGRIMAGSNRPAAATQPAAKGPQALPPIRQPSLDADGIRDLVSRVVQKTLGKS